MTIAEIFLPEFEREMASTRSLLQRVTDDKLDWQAHEKLRSIGWVASHLAEIVGWVEGIISQDSWDIHPVGGEPDISPTLTSRQEILESFDANVAIARAQIAATTDDLFGHPWSLLTGGEVIFTMPKSAVIRTWVLNHLIHHRGHLCVYLRLNDIPIPGMYGPSGDEDMS